jgi:CheY-like chemotaxis protein
MTVPLMALPLSVPIPSPVKKKRVLLVDTSSHLRDLRAETMRKLGIDVDCAANISEARCWWRADLYNLVLINMGNDPRQRDRFCDDIRGAKPPQQVAFLVGKPEYLAGLPNENGDVSEEEDPGGNGKAQVGLTTASRDMPQRWGILEASRRISAVRSAGHARSQAMRERPEPPRDLETRAERQTASRIGNELTLDELLKQEMQ